MRTSCRTTRLWIPHSLDPSCKIAGDLEQLEPDEPTQNRKIALILHGTMGHKDYLFQKKLAKALPIDSFRFDFRGNNETGGVWKQGALDEDLEDLQVVAQYLQATFGYVVDLVVGHSRGSLVGMRWVATTEEGRRVRGFVNVSGRYRMERIYDRLDFYQPYFDSQGYYDWHVTVARKDVVGRMYPHDLEKFASWDQTPVRDRFPPETHVLTIHGLQDKTVPPYDAIYYSRVFGSRSGGGTHNLHYIEEADHNFTAHRDDVVETILRWLSLLEKGGLQTGVWGSEPIKGRL
ncbi:ectomycorrhiza-regulated esterase [Fomitiporia mediterranea MF3/22]|uniref:ectomycorrhiza-regulated esterase n=1 Tax=Fomitiporia mediterranea (strain MF3/22) TaxID=694068 RepID=UPI00044084CD|nr:ectomycorrhiza-regulated esterase [Fomitiporia mediterranea MF3/22]EJC98146.1 ectomycorrhiza-regulated esterase [Fomitiporia mediterranea MF3/22]